MRFVSKTILKTACVVVFSILFAGAGLQDRYQEGIQYLHLNDYKKAYGILKPLAQQGHARSQVQIGHLYYSGQGVDRNYRRARHWYKRAADQGDVEAQFHLAKMYFEGRGVPQDYRTAWNWFLKAAERGYAPAQYRLGLMYELSQGVPQDYREAALWYLKAAKQGMSQAQFMLADLYYKGQGVQRDIPMAYKWVSLAVSTTEPVGDDYNDMVALRNKLEKLLDAKQVRNAGKGVSRERPVH